MRVKDERLARAKKTVKMYEQKAAQQMKEVRKGLKKMGASAKPSRIKEREKMGGPKIKPVSASEYLKRVKEKKKKKKK